MNKLIRFLKSTFEQRSPRDQYLMQSADLADLELRQKYWDKMQLEQSRWYPNRNF